ncbi:MAG: VanZ family protein [Fimbriimonas ginsengisoli]|uniref:VanZ family protein n=1 Tax=Fimbriimonas ginsengisoli TaxID=1005039 RepID=A0A931PTP6_FIMGI|nr:VanZ family protein [Fimbriimonas ginsengisoli]
MSAPLRAVSLALSAIAGAVLAAWGVAWLCGRYWGAWLPFALSVAVTALLGLLPRARPWAVRGPYALMFGGGVLALWFVTRLKPPWDWADHVAPYLAPAAGVLAVVGLVWWQISIAVQPEAKRPPAGWLVWLAAAAWLVAYFSSARGAPGVMERLFSEWFGLSLTQAHDLTVVARKAIHFAFYGLVGLGGARAAIGSRATPATSAAFAASLALSYALFDEYRQSTFPGRTGSLADIALDMAGAGLFLWVALARKR